MEDSIELSYAAADGLSLALDQDFYRFESLERMAWIVLVLRKLEDKDEWFPRGKWATIQSVEAQLETAAKEFVEELTQEKIYERTRDEMS